MAAAVVGWAERRRKLYFRDSCWGKGGQKTVVPHGLTMVVVVVTAALVTVVQHPRRQRKRLLPMEE